MEDHGAPSAGVMLLAPAPFLTMTVENPVRAGIAALGDEIHVHPGGQGVWQARMLVRLGVRVVFCTALGGELGQVLSPLLSAEGVELRSIPGAQTGGRIQDRRDGRRSMVAQMHGLPMLRHYVDDLCELAMREGLRQPVSVLSGPADPALFPAVSYRRLAADLSANGSRVVVDLAGDYLACALAGRVAFVKVSHEELLQDGRADDDTEPALMRALRRLREEGADWAVVSRAERPALALFGEDAYRIHTPELEVVDPTGAGDSMTAGIAAVLARGGDPLEAVRTGAAAGALNVTRHGLGTGSAETVEVLAEHVRVERWRGRP